MHASLFCLAATGSGWGSRLKLALVCGCIPVIIDDQVRVSLPGVSRVSPAGLVGGRLLGLPGAQSSWSWRRTAGIPVITDDLVSVSPLVRGTPHPKPCTWSAWAT